MIAKIPDNRIGVRSANKEGNYKITQMPTHYAIGGYWSQKSHSAPTTVYFGDDRRFFYILPTGVPKLNEEILAELNAIVKRAVSNIEDAK